MDPAVGHVEQYGRFAAEFGRRLASKQDGQFPDQYPDRYGEQSFDDEYRSAELEEIEEGPFPAGLAACLQGPPPSVCWAYSNLNKVMWAMVFRSQPDRDIIIVPRVAGGPRDPSTPELDVTARLRRSPSRPDLGRK